MQSSAQHRLTKIEVEKTGDGSRRTAGKKENEMRKFLVLLALGITVLALDVGSASAGPWRRGGVVYSTPVYNRAYYSYPSYPVYTTPVSYSYGPGAYYTNYAAPAYNGYAYPYSGYYSSPGVYANYGNRVVYSTSGYNPVYTTYGRGYYGYPVGGYISTGNRVYYRR